jgi:hypothetical protein
VTAASEPDILAGVERWARERRSPGDGQHVSHIVAGEHEWRVFSTSGTTRDHVQVGLWRRGSDRPCLGEWQLPPALALAWALLVEKDAGPVDVGRCPACVARGGPMEWHRVVGTSMADAHYRITASVGPPWDVAAHRWYPSPDISHGVASRPCPVCNGTGREAIPAARLLLDAASGDATARDLLLVHADQLQARGDPLGELLGLALGPWTGEPTDDIVERRELHINASTSAMVEIEREGFRCDWSGDTGGDGWPYARTVLGHPHTAAALRWLEWLTWGREFEHARQVALHDAIAGSLARPIAPTLPRV